MKSRHSLSQTAGTSYWRKVAATMIVAALLAVSLTVAMAIPAGCASQTEPGQTAQRPPSEGFGFDPKAGSDSTGSAGAAATTDGSGQAAGSLHDRVLAERGAELNRGASDGPSDASANDQSSGINVSLPVSQESQQSGPADWSGYSGLGLAGAAATPASPSAPDLSSAQGSTSGTTTTTVPSAGGAPASAAGSSAGAPNGTTTTTSPPWNWTSLRSEPATTTTTLYKVNGYTVVGETPRYEVLPNRFQVEEDGETRTAYGSVAGRQVDPYWEDYLMYVYESGRPSEDPEKLEEDPVVKWLAWADWGSPEPIGFSFDVAQDSITPIRAAGAPAVDTFTTEGIDLFVPGGGQGGESTLSWGIIWDNAVKPWILGEKLGDGSWRTNDVGLTKVGGPAPGFSPAAVSWGTETHVFLRGADNALYWRRGTDTWGTWQYLGGLLASDPAATSRRPGQIDIFTRGPNGHLYHRVYENEKWSTWTDLGGNLASGPAAVARDKEHLDVFARGADGKLWHRSWYVYAGWSDWESLGGQPTLAPAVASSTNDRLDVFVRGLNGTLWSRTWTERNGWLPWRDMGGSPIFSSPSAVSWGMKRIDVFACGLFPGVKDTVLYHTWWDGSRWWP